MVFAEIISSTLKMEAIDSSETSVNTQRTTRRHISKDYTLRNFVGVCNRIRHPGSSVRTNTHSWSASHRLGTTHTKQI
jgi:hypothetical protein